MKILRLIWKDLPNSLRDKFRVEIENMAIWALRSSLRRDGSVDFYPAMFESGSAEYYYLVSFLEQIGYWQKDQQFWIGDDIPEVPYEDYALSICSSIKPKLRFPAVSGWAGACHSGEACPRLPRQILSARNRGRALSPQSLSPLCTSSCHCALAAIQRGPWQTVVQFEIGHRLTRASPFQPLRFSNLHGYG